MKCRNCRSRNVVEQVCRDCGVCTNKLRIDTGDIRSTPMLLGVPVVCDQAKRVYYFENRAGLTHLCSIHELPDYVIPLCFDIFMLYRECRHVIRHMEALHHAIVYYSSWISKHPIPLRRLLTSDVGKKNIVHHVRIIQQLVSGDLDNSHANDVPISGHRRYRVDNRAVYPYLAWPSNAELVITMCDAMRRCFQTGSLDAMKIILRMYWEVHGRCASVETLSAAVYFHIVRFEHERDRTCVLVRLDAIAQYVKRSESSIQCALRLLPALNVRDLKRKREFET